MLEFQKLAKEAAQGAGKAILSVYKKTDSVAKEDGSPLTLADTMAHQTIYDLLSQTDYPVVSEEAEDIHLNAKDYWLVDPLDGTKDFLAGNGQFTINIAFMRNNHPVLGVIYAPALDEWYTSFENEKTDAYISSTLRMAVSNFHDCENTGRFGELNAVIQKVPLGSALKFGRMAKGFVDVYPRFVGTYEWDTAAGHAILESVGGQIIDLQTGQELAYGKGPKRLNGSFVAIREGYTFSEFIWP